MAYTYQNVAAGTLLALLRNRLQNSSFYSDTELYENINEAIRIYQLATLRWKARFAASTVAGLTFYDLTTLAGTLDANGNPQILMPLRVAFNGAPLFFVTLDDMDSAGIDNWQLQTTATAGAPSAPELWGNVGLNYLFIYPADAAGSGGLQVDAATQPPLVGPGGQSFLNLDSGEISTLLDYAQHASSIKRGPGRVAATMPKLRSFMRAVALQNSMFTASNIFKSSYSEHSDRRTKPRLVGDRTGVPTPARYR